MERARVRDKPDQPLLSSVELAGEWRETFCLATGDHDFVGATLHRPPGPANAVSSKAILLLPGWSGPRTGPAELLVFLARRLVAEGHVVLRIDLQGRGDASGVFEACALDRMIDNASRGFDRLKQVAPGSSLVVGGICSGANVALGLASLRPADVAAALAFSALPYQPSRGEDLERRRRWKNVKQYAAKALKPATWGKLWRGEVDLDRVRKNVTEREKPGAGDRNLKDSARDIEKALLDWKGRALFVWGGADEEAGPSRLHYERLHGLGFAGPPGRARFETLEGANHNFYARAWRERLASLSTAFLAPDP